MKKIINLNFIRVSDFDLVRVGKESLSSYEDDENFDARQSGRQKRFQRQSFHAKDQNGKDPERHPVSKKNQLDPPAIL